MTKVVVILCMSVLVLILMISQQLACTAKKDLAGPIYVSPQPTSECVIFRMYMPNAYSVAVIGTFNSWRASDAFRMNRGVNNVWEVCVRLGPGTYEYMFLINGARRIWDPENPNRIRDKSDGFHSVLFVR